MIHFEKGYKKIPQYFFFGHTFTTSVVVNVITLFRKKNATFVLNNTYGLRIVVKTEKIKVLLNNTSRFQSSMNFQKNTEKKV